MASVTLPLALFSESEGVALSGEGGGTIAVSYRDGDEYVAGLPYALGWLTGDGDALLEYGEVALLTVVLADAEGTVLARATGAERLTLELTDATGGTLSVSQRLPPILQPVMGLR